MTEEELLDEAYKGFLAYISGLEEAFIPEVYKVLQRSLEGATREEILKVASTQTGKLITNVSESTIKGIAESIKSSLENQAGVDGAARALRDMIGLNAEQVKSINNLEKELKKKGLSASEIEKVKQKEIAKKKKKRSEVIAQTEMREAVSQGEKEVMKNRGARYKVAISSQDGKVSDVCQTNEAAGPIPIDDNFPSGHDTPPFHPECRCSVSFITSDEQVGRERERVEKRSQKTESAKK
jgi:SPP1 gp7 family putative phage head morphogenesis protein